MGGWNILEGLAALYLCYALGRRVLGPLLGALGEQIGARWRPVLPAPPSARRAARRLLGRPFPDYAKIARLERELEIGAPPGREREERGPAPVGGPRVTMAEATEGVRRVFAFAATGRPGPARAARAAGEHAAGEHAAGERAAGERAAGERAALERIAATGARVRFPDALLLDVLEENSGPEAREAVRRFLEEERAAGYAWSAWLRGTRVDIVPGADPPPEGPEGEEPTPFPLANLIALRAVTTGAAPEAVGSALDAERTLRLVRARDPEQAATLERLLAWERAAGSGRELVGVPRAGGGVIALITALTRRGPDGRYEPPQVISGVVLAGGPADAWEEGEDAGGDEG